MSATESFDDFLSTERLHHIHDLKPFQHREKQGEHEVTLKWLVDNFNNMEKAAHSRFITYRRYHALYKGIHWRYFDSRDSQRDIEYTQRKPRHVVNFVHEHVEGKVSDLARLNVATTVIPSHDEISDINNAKAVKTLLDGRCAEINYELIEQSADRIKYIYGHVFEFVMWDYDKGPMHPAFKRISKRYNGKIPKSVMKKLKNKGLKHNMGDVTVLTVGPDKVFPELGKDKWEDINHIDLVEWVHVEELKAEYPNKKEFIMESSRDFFDYEFTELTRPKNYTQVRHFYHKKTKWLPEGQYIKYTDDVILEMGPYPYDEEGLPFEHDRDIEVYGELWGRSFISQIEQMQRMYNNVQSGVARDYGIGSAPKWMMPKGSAQISSLNNEFTIVEYSGPIAPQLVQSRPTSNQAFEVLDRTEKKIAQHSQRYDIARGEVPQGITANSALRFLDEQQSQRQYISVSKRKNRVVRVKTKMMKRMQQFYKPSDERVVKSLGPNNEHLIEYIKDADFSKQYDIKIQNSPALPDSKSGKISTIIDLNAMTQTDPIFRREEVIQMLDLGLDDGFKNGATAAVSNAKYIVDRMLKGEKVPEPQSHDNPLVHYSIFDRLIQSTMFNSKAPEDIKIAVKLRVKVIEGLMYEKAKTNKKFLMQLMEHETFPMFFTPEVPLWQILQFMEAPPMEPADTGGGADTSKVENLPKINQETGE